MSVKSKAKKCLVEGAHCDLCDLAIPLDADIWPIEPLPAVGNESAKQRRAKGRYWWVHTACAEKELGELFAPPCIRWTKRRECAYGNDCFYSHPAAEDEVAAPQAGTATANASAETLPGVGWASKKRKKVRNTCKCSALRRFLLDNFGGIVGLRQGTGIIDIAGGKGVLSFELLNCLGVPCLVVEPQPALRLSRSRDALVKRDAYGRNPLYSEYLDPEVYARNRAAGGLSPDHLRIFFDRDLVAWLSAVPNEEADPGYFDLKLKAATNASQLWDGFGHNLTQDSEAQVDPETGSGDEGGCCGESEAPLPPRLVTNSDEVRRRFMNCSLIVGLHPDSATEVLVDFALAHCRPFAVVPCCVHAKNAPRRFLADGTEVRTYEAFVKFLLAKNPRIQSAELPIEGRSTVLFVSTY
jgi:hypothetical protein